MAFQPVTWRLQTETLSTLDHTLIMGVVNVTPDSFSDGGAFSRPDAAIRHGLELWEAGADLVDVGGESTRLGSVPAVVIVADDSEDHHNGKGICVGLTGGVAKWRDKVDDWGLDIDTPVDVGEFSDIEELTCLRAD